MWGPQKQNATDQISPPKPLFFCMVMVFTHPFFVTKIVICIIIKHWLWTVVCGVLVWFWWCSCGWCDFCFYTPASSSNLHTWELISTLVAVKETQSLSQLCVKMCRKVNWQGRPSVAGRNEQRVPSVKDD